MERKIKQTKKAYDKFFPKDKKNLALEHALDIRKFEIEHYWKRASYFWVLIAAAFVAFAAVITAGDGLRYKDELAIFMACMGQVFSVAWIAVNMGSKFWQENWESHVDMLENSEMGPLYKIVFRGDDKNSGNTFTRSAPLSVSKINQLVSIYIALIWFLLLVFFFGSFLMEYGFFEPMWFIVLLTYGVCLSFFTVARTSAFKCKKWELMNLRNKPLE